MRPGPARICDSWERCLRQRFRICRWCQFGLAAIAEIIHDTDLLDGKFGRKEGFGIDEVLNGWAKQGSPDSELLEKGIEVMEGLYHSVRRRSGVK